MKIRWSYEALEDVDRLVDFVAAYDVIHANEIEQELQEAPKELLTFARRGSRLSDFDPREVREYRVGGYLLRYELSGPDLIVQRFFHAREDRF